LYALDYEHHDGDLNYYLTPFFYWTFCGIWQVMYFNGHWTSWSM